VRETLRQGLHGWQVTDVQVVMTHAGYLAIPRASTVRGALGLVDGEVPAARVHDLERQIPALTRGEGVVGSGFDHWRPVRGAPPTRPRSGRNPLDRKAYLQQLRRRVP
jgi:ribosomal protection tetracycline resistance protein